MMPVCGALRSDGAPCEDELGHYGGHVWPELVLPIVRVGDCIQMSPEFVHALRSGPLITARVREIRTEDDGTKVLVMENA